MSKARNPISFPGMLRMASGVDLLESKSRREEDTLTECMEWEEKMKKTKQKKNPNPKISVGNEKVDDIDKRECLEPLSVEKLLLSPPL